MRTVFVSRSGMAYLVVLGFAIIMAMFLMMIGQYNANAIQLLSKNARDYLSSVVAETGLNCVLAELNINNEYTTHGLYKWGKDDPWSKPVKERPSLLAGKRDLDVKGVKGGIYSGETDQGSFKLKIASVFGKENSQTKTLKESQMYLRCEVVAHVGRSNKSEDDSYRRLTAVIEKRSPVSEHLLFDGELLDLGIGPYSAAPNPLRMGRLYGYQGISMNTAGGKDQGSELFAVEKIETAGMIKAPFRTRIEFADKKSTKLGPDNDSSNFDRFQSFGGYLLDNAHGGRAIKLSQLPRESYYAKAKRRKNTGGLIIEKSSVPKSMPVSTWKNPYDTATTFYDLNFSGYNNGEDDPNDDGEPGQNDDEENPCDPPFGSDDPEPLNSLRGRSLLIYSEVPLRVWGCPDRSVTIFCEKDIVVAGDFNQNPLTIQDYPDANYLDYKTPIKNGKKNAKVGAMLIAMGRVLIDSSRPSLYLKNELRPYLAWQMAMALHPVSTTVEEQARKDLCPIDPDKRGGILGLGPPDPQTGEPSSIYGSIFRLVKNPSIATGPMYTDPACMGDIIELFNPGNDKRPRFGIRDSAERDKIVLMVDQACRGDGVVTKKEFDDIIDYAWKIAAKEENEAVTLDAGPAGMVRFLFDAASLKFDDGVWMPELTVNAAMVTSVRRSSKWTIGSGLPKVCDEIGNAGGGKGFVEYLKAPRYLIQRVYGSEIRLGTAESYFMNGAFTGTSVLRRRFWDKSLTGGKFQPTALPFAYNVFSCQEEAISKKDFDAF